jgi:hypothetical protein
LGVRAEDAPPLSRGAYEQLVHATKEILVRFPPETHFYVGVGRSPSGVLEALHALLPRRAQGFPASGLSDRAQHEISPAELVEYERHLDHFFPDAARLHGRTVLLMDVVADGGTLRKLKPIFQRHFESRGIDVRVETLALNETNGSVDHALSGRAAVASAGTEAIARYAAHHIGRKRLEELSPNPRRSDFVRSLLVRMSEDPALDRFLRFGFRDPVELRGEPSTERRQLIHADGRSEHTKEELDTRIRSLVADAFAASRFIEADEPAGGTVELRFQRDYDPNMGPVWRITSRLRQELRSWLKSDLDGAIERFTRNKSAPRANHSLIVRVGLHPDGTIAGASDIELERVPTPVQLHEAPRAEMIAASPLSPQPKGLTLAQERSAVAELAEAFSSVAFHETDGRPARSVSLELELVRLLPHRDWSLWKVKTRIPERKGWEPVVRYQSETLSALARDPQAPHDPRGLRLTIRLDEEGVPLGPEHFEVTRFALPPSNR